MAAPRMTLCRMIAIQTANEWMNEWAERDTYVLSVLPEIVSFFLTLLTFQSSDFHLKMNLTWMLKKPFLTWCTCQEDLHVCNNCVLIFLQTWNMLWSHKQLHVVTWNHDTVHFKRYNTNTSTTYFDGTVFQCNQPHSYTGPSQRHSCRLRFYSRMFLHSLSPSGLHHRLQQKHHIWQNQEHHLQMYKICVVTFCLQC